MKRRAFLASLVVVLLTLSAATTALAAGPHSADQFVDVQILAADTLTIEVQDGIGFGPVVEGAGVTDDYWFNMNVTNTTANGWTVTVRGDDFLRYYWENCDEFGCSDRLQADDPPVYFDSEYLYVHGGSWGNWANELVDVIDAFGVNVSQTPQTIMTASPAAFGYLHFDPGPYARLTVPETVPAYGDYYTTLTYTIQEVLP
jgi:hypothetical protein